MKLIQLSNKYPGEYLGRKGDETDYDTLIDEDCRVLKPDGTLLCVVLKKAHSIESMKTAWPVLKHIPIESNNRGIASGEPLKKRIRLDGTVSKQTIGAPVDSGILGYFERTSRMPYCRACAWNLKNPELWDKILPLSFEAEELLKKHEPVRHGLQAKVAQKSHPDFLIKGTNFSTLTVNRNFRTAYHRDAGNIKEGISCMSVLREGQWQGANLVFPEFRVAAKLDGSDLIIFDPHEIHGNTPLIKITKNAIRCSIVYYFREKIQFCLSAEEELKIVKNRSQGEELFKTKLRKAKKDV